MKIVICSTNLSAHARRFLAHAGDFKKSQIGMRLLVQEFDTGRGIGETQDLTELPPLPSTPLPRCAAGGARGGAEFRAGLMRVGGLEDFALLAKRLLGK
jgi:hypothetical protein